MAYLCGPIGNRDIGTGVIPIYRPAGRVRGRIFAIHGPGGSWGKTWSHDGPPVADSSISTTPCPSGSQKSVFWLRDLLPEKFPHCAIYSIGYGKTQYLPIRTLNFVVGDLEAHLRTTPVRERAPIVFIAHGFGGVLLKEVIQALWGPEGRLQSCTPELDRLRGFLFLATPQRFNQEPSHYQSLARARPFLEGIAPDISNDEWALCKKRLDAITAEFRSLVKANSLKIISVSELAPSDKLALVQKDEVPLGDLPDETELVVDGAASHFSLPRFINGKEQRFADICKWLEMIFQDALSVDREWDKMVFWLDRKRPYGEQLTRPTVALFSDSEIPSTASEFSNDDSRHKNFWLHFPFNHELFMRNAIESMVPTYKLTHYPFGPDPLGTVLRARSNFPHSRYVLPNVELHHTNLLDPEVGCNVRSIHLRIFVSRWICSWDIVKLGINETQLQLPYLHWDTVASAQALSRSPVPNLLGGPPGWSNDILRSLLEVSEDCYHPRRTLDQYYYSRMKDTTKRDNDQVVSRQTGLYNDERLVGENRYRHKDTRETNDDDVDKVPPGGPTMIMVDQLWLCLWIVEQQEFKQADGSDHHEVPGPWSLLSSAVITAFPHTSYPRPDNLYPNLYDTADVRQSAVAKLEKLDDRDTHRASSLVSSILAASILGTISLRQNWSINFLELFREAIGEAAEKQDNFFRDFDKSMRPGQVPINVEQRREEVKLGLDIADIVDELHMLAQLFDTQKDVLSKAIEKTAGITCLGEIRSEVKRIRDELMDVHSPQIYRMLEDSERVQKRLMDLLDLQQKEQNIYEAQRANQQALFTAKHALSAEDQADATNAQSQILFIFTLVTIVFLPLSFITSYFGMFNVNNQHGGDVTYGRSYVDTVMGAASGAMTTAFLVGAVAWYYRSKKESADQRAEELLTYEDNGDLPPGLIFDDSQDRQRMEKLRPGHVNRAKKSKTVVDEKEDEAVRPVESSLDKLISTLGKRRLEPADQGVQQMQV